MTGSSIIAQFDVGPATLPTWNGNSLTDTFSSGFKQTICHIIKFAPFKFSFHVYRTGCRRYDAEEKKAAHPLDSASWQVPLRTLTKNEKRGHAACVTTRRTIVFGFSFGKVRGFATRPNTLLRLPVALGCGGRGATALPFGRDKRGPPVASGRWLGNETSSLLSSLVTGPMSKINASHMCGTRTLYQTISVCDGQKFCIYDFSSIGIFPHSDEI